MPWIVGSNSSMAIFDRSEDFLPERSGNGNDDTFSCDIYVFVPPTEAIFRDCLICFTPE